MDFNNTVNLIWILLLGLVLGLGFHIPRIIGRLDRVIKLLEDLKSLGSGSEKTVLKSKDSDSDTPTYKGKPISGF